MNRMSSSPAHLPHFEAPSLLELTEDAIVAVTRFIPKADNPTLARLVQTCRDLQRIVGTDALLSYFYAARASYETGDTDKKVAVFCTLCEWINQVADQLPPESRWQLIEHLSMLGTRENLSASLPVDHLEDTTLRKIAKAVNSVAELASRELANHRAAIDEADHSPGTEILEAGFRLAMSLDCLSVLNSHYHTAWHRKYTAGFEPMRWRVR